MALLSPRLSSWKGPLPDLGGKLAASLLLPVPLGPFSRINIEETVRYLETLRGMMEAIFPGRHEILLAPHGERQPAFGLLLDRLIQATSGHRVFRWIRGNHPGPGAAIREAVFLSRGKKLLVGSLECHYDPSFFRKALDRLGPGCEGVVANRRLPDSEFTVPVTHLFLVYRRHLLGVLLSRFWSPLFKLDLTDNLSGAFVLKRGFALRVFNRITCPGFLYEAEMAVVAKRNRCALSDLPARFFLEKEKPRLRVYREVLSVIRWTWRFFRNVHRGEYDFLKMNGNHLTADDWGLSPAVNDGILDMVRLGHLRRVSVMAEGRFVDYRLRELKRVPGVEFGLHFNLTNPESGGMFDSPASFFWAWAKDRWVRRGGLVEKVRRSLREQLEALQKKGIQPRRLEGHHHVHTVPGLLDEVADILREFGVRRVRVPYHRSLWFGRKAPIAWLGHTVEKAAKRLQFSFDPFYYPTLGDFSSFNRLVHCLNRSVQTEVLIHPAFRDDIAQEAPSDTYRRHRVIEFNVLRLLSIELRSMHRKGAYEAKE